MLGRKWSALRNAHSASAIRPWLLNTLPKFPYAETEIPLRNSSNFQMHDGIEARAWYISQSCFKKVKQTRTFRSSK